MVIWQLHGMDQTTGEFSSMNLKDELISHELYIEEEYWNDADNLPKAMADMYRWFLTEYKDQLDADMAEEINQYIEEANEDQKWVHQQ